MAMERKKRTNWKKDEGGFTLIELLIVVVVIGLMLAVIAPRGQRALVDSKYSIVRQNAGELASAATTWAESEMASQDDVAGDGTSTLATLADYYAWLSGETGANGSMDDNATFTHVADTTGRWQIVAATETVSGRFIGGTEAAPSGTPVNYRVIEKKLINPFTGLDVFDLGNYSAGSAVPGAIAFDVAVDGSTATPGNNSQWVYAGLVYQGTENSNDNEMHGSMKVNDLAGLRNGVFVAKSLNIDPSAVAASTP